MEESRPEEVEMEGKGNIQQGRHWHQLQGLQLQKDPDPIRFLNEDGACRVHPQLLTTRWAMSRGGASPGTSDISSTWPFYAKPHLQSERNGAGHMDKLMSDRKKTEQGNLGAWKMGNCTRKEAISF